MEWLDNIVFWHWWILAGILLIIELSSPVFYFLWMGIAAGLVGLLLLVIPGMPIELQLTLFAILSIVATVVWRRYREKHPIVSDQPNLNKRGRQYVGRTFTLEHPIVNGVGKVTVDDSTWKVKGPDLPAGSKVRVADVDSVIFVVELAE